MGLGDRRCAAKAHAGGGGGAPTFAPSPARAALGAAVALLLAATLGGCTRMEPVEITNGQQAWDYLASELAQKYGEQFEFVEVAAVYQRGKIDYKAEAMTYAALFAPADDPGKVFGAAIDARDGWTIDAPQDDYQQYLFKEQAEELCASKLRGRDDLAGWAVVLKGRFDDRLWQGAPLSRYLGSGGFFDPYDGIFLVLPRGLSPDEQAAVIHGCLEDLAQAGCKYETRAVEEGGDPIKESLYMDSTTFGTGKPDVPAESDLAESIRTNGWKDGKDAFGKPLPYWDGDGAPDGSPADPSDPLAYPSIAWNPGHGPGVSFDGPPTG